MKLVFKYLISVITIIALNAQQYPRTIFSPGGHPLKALVQYIQQEQNSIKAAYFIITDRTVRDAFIKAHSRGVHVEIIVDKNHCKESPHAQDCITTLRKRGIAVIEYDGATANGFIASIMHHKFAIFYNNREANGTCKPLLWTGSLNPTLRGGNCNCEDINIFDNSTMIKDYQHRFEIVKQQALGKMPKKPVPATSFIDQKKLSRSKSNKCNSLLKKHMHTLRKLRR